MKNLFFISLLVLLLSCSSKTKTADRSIASLDNNRETELDSPLEFREDPNEEENAQKVASVISNFVRKQHYLRASAPSNSEESERLTENLPAKDYATRDVHRKAHGCYTAKVHIDTNIQKNLNQTLEKFIKERKTEGRREPSNPVPEKIDYIEQLGVFKPDKTYDAIVRYSNGHPGNRGDMAPDARGMAVKILPEGTITHPATELTPAKLNPATELDILTINFPTFFVNSPEKYIKINEYFLESAEDFQNGFNEQVKSAQSIFFSGMTQLERKLALLSNGSIIENPLYQQYYSMVPSRLGRRGDIRAVKYSFRPEACPGQTNFNDEVSEQWSDWTRQRHFALIEFPLEKKSTPPYKNNYSPNYLGFRIGGRLIKGPFCFALLFQLYRDQNSTNIEDSTDIWLHDSADKNSWIKTVKSGFNLDKSYYESLNTKSYSPYIKVASIQINRTDLRAEYLNNKTCEDLSFNPWNGRIDIHKPLGVVSRMKRRVYNASRRTRHEINKLPSQSWER